MNIIEYDGKYKKAIFLYAVVDALFAVAYLSNISMYINIALVAFLFALIATHSDEHIWLYITLMPLYPSIRFGSTQVLFVFAIISIIKFLYQHRRLSTTSLCLLSMFYIIIIEVLFDYFNWNIGQFLNLFTIILYSLLLMAAYPWNKINYKQFLNVMIYVGLLCIVLTFLSVVMNGESLAMYVSTTERYVRFGESEASHSLGGAMGIPIYAMITVACCYVKIINERISPFKKIIYIAIIFGCIFFGLLTHSRNFLGGLAGFTFIAILATLIRRNNIRGVILTLIIATIGFVIAIRNQKWLSTVLTSFEARGAWTEDVRVLVWHDCFEYWSNNIISLIFGLGTKNYTFVGAKQGYLFYMCAHNIILDCVMSWGIIGFLLFLYLVRHMYISAKGNLNFRNAVIFFVPLFTWLIMKMTSGSFEDPYEYFFVISLVCIAAYSDHSTAQMEE